MKNFRIGNDLTIFWSIYKPGIEGDVPYDLADQPITLYMTNADGREKVRFSFANANTIKWEFRGVDQRVLGPYTLTLEIQSTTGRQIFVDQCHPFALVAKSCLEKDVLGYYNIENGRELTLDSRLNIIRINPVIPMAKLATPDKDGNKYWYVDGVNTGERVTGDSTYQLAVKNGQIFNLPEVPTEAEWIEHASLRVFDGGNASSTFGGARHIDCGGAKKTII